MYSHIIALWLQTCINTCLRDNRHLPFLLNNLHCYVGHNKQVARSRAAKGQETWWVFLFYFLKFSLGERGGERPYSVSIHTAHICHTDPYWPPMWKSRNFCNEPINPTARHEHLISLQPAFNFKQLNASTQLKSKSTSLSPLTITKIMTTRCDVAVSMWAVTCVKTVIRSALHIEHFRGVIWSRHAIRELGMRVRYFSVYIDSFQYYSHI